jgi:bis(5'-nucleosidyl)-tetraphosphatase
MLLEHSAGAVIYRREPDSILFLLLHYEEGHWGASKGHVEKGESLEQTARREIREETGLTDIRFLPGFQIENTYVYRKEGRLSQKTATFYLAETFTPEVQLSFEHTEFVWLPFAEAYDRVTFQSEKEVWQAANDYIVKMTADA